MAKDLTRDKFTSMTSASCEMASARITRVREPRSLVLVVVSRRCKISRRNMCKGKRMGSIVRRRRKSVSQTGIFLRAAYVSICSVANKIAFYDASKCHDPPSRHSEASQRSLANRLVLDISVDYAARLCFHVLYICCLTFTFYKSPLFFFSSSYFFFSQKNCIVFSIISFDIN